MRTAAEQLSQSSHKLAEAMYSKAAQQQAGPQGPTDGQGATENSGEPRKKKDDVVDADFEEVKE
jgi:molecular chaperone DnaK